MTSDINVRIMVARTTNIRTGTFIAYVQSGKSVWTK
jgi:hypothetical protein